MSCTDGWKITGYFVPESEEYGGTFETIEVDSKSFILPKGFIDSIKMEGWGLITGDRYLGWIGSQWRLAADPLNAVGSALVRGSLAVDRDVISLRTRVTIPSAPEPWNTVQFIADDTGGAIKGKHVDIYCGAGKQGRQESMRVTSTGYNGTVCF